MVAISLGHLLSSAHASFSVRWHMTSTLLEGYPGIPYQPRRVCIPVGHSRFISCSKRSDFQDFQGYARPLRLLPATEANICRESSIVELTTSLGVDESQSLYMIRLHTSGAYGSCLTDLNAGILLCMIDENGDSILQRISASPMKDHPVQTKEMTIRDHSRFQRGFVDEFIFEGPKLGKVEALWIGLESGRWRLGGLSLTVVCGCQPPFKEKDGKPIQYIGLRYDLEAEDILLGEGGDMSMAELRPHLVTELPVVDLLTFSSSEDDQLTLLSREISSKEGMKEYADLKFSLLLYDVMLIFAGTSIASISAGDTAALAFLTGGLGGFFYLLLLQRSVDGLPVPASMSMNMVEDNRNQLFRNVQSPILTLALALAFGVVAVKYRLGDTPIVLTPKDLMVGMMGFLACKIAVVLAAFKPMPMGLKENK